MVAVETAVTGADTLALPESMSALVKQSARTGSRVICRPVPEGRDDDWIVLVENVEAFHGVAMQENWKGPKSVANADKYPDSFESLHGPNDLNLLVTASEDFFRRFDAATHVARRLNLLEKPDRIALFQAVLYANKWDDRSAAPRQEPA